MTSPAPTPFAFSISPGADPDTFSLSVLLDTGSASGVVSAKDLGKFCDAIDDALATPSVEQVRIGATADPSKKEPVLDPAASMLPDAAEHHLTSVRMDTLPHHITRGLWLLGELVDGKRISTVEYNLLCRCIVLFDRSGSRGDGFVVPSWTLDEALIFDPAAARVSSGPAPARRELPFVLERYLAQHGSR